MYNYDINDIFIYFYGYFLFVWCYQIGTESEMASIDYK